MNRKIILVLLTLVNTSIAFSQSAKEIAKNSLPSTVSLVMEDNHKQPVSLGSGFIVADGKIVTNLHVIEGAKYGSVFVNGSSKKHKIEGYLAIDKENDLAILSVPSISDSALPLGNSSMPEVGERIYAIGNPKGLSGTISEGIISGIRNLEGKDLIQITAPISPGSSGGPVIDNNGRVVGVAVGTLTSGQNLNFAIPTSTLITLLEKESSSITPLNVGKGTASPKIAKGEIDIKDAIKIRNWKYERGMGCDDSYNCILSISILNGLPYTIRNLKTIFILYDKTGIPVDYFEKEFFRHDEKLRPFLAKTIDFDVFDWKKYPALRKSPGDNLEIRVLDFEIIED